MKKLILAAVVILSFGLTSASAQEVKLGVHGGVPVGDLDGVSNFALGADVAYLYNTAGIFQLGGTTGYHHYFGESGTEGDLEWEVDDFSFLPIAAAGRVSLGDVIFAGVDLGYAIGLNDGNDGGFYYAPKLGFGLFMFDVVGSYTGVSLDGGNASSVNVGVEFTF